MGLASLPSAAAMVVVGIVSVSESQMFKSKEVALDAARKKWLRGGGGEIEIVLRACLSSQKSWAASSCVKLYV